MDMKETSAMTEASGFVNGQGMEHASEAMPRDKREAGGSKARPSRAALALL
jgi:hypothetical protein